MPSQHPFEDDYFVDRTFTDLDLTDADLSEREFEGCTFRRCTFQESRWARTVIEDSVFEDCDLSRMMPSQLALRGVVFRNTKLVGVNWKGLERGPDIGFESCDLRYASFVSIKLGPVRMTDCELREANFIEVDLTGADFGGSNLEGSTFDGCTLTKADFSRARGVYLNPESNTVKGARIALDAAVLLAESFGMSVEVPEEEE